MKICLIVAVLCASALAAQPITWADTTSDSARKEARERFDRGLQLFNDGDNTGALAEFKRAYDLIPNKILLLNIGLVYAAMGRPVESVSALDKLLADTKDLDATRVQKARSTRDLQSRRVGMLRITTNVPASIEIDGLQVAQTPQAEPLRVAGGTHVVSAVAAGHLPLRREVSVAGGATESLTLDLSPSESRLAHITVRSATPGADVVLDGQVVGRTPLPASLSVAAAAHVVELRRRGFMARKQDIVLGDGAQGDIVFDLQEDSQAPASDFGRLVLQPSEGEVELTVNGKPLGVYRDSVRLPVGPHTLRIERAGFDPVDRAVEISAVAESHVKITLRPTPETRSTFVDSTRARRRWAMVSLIGGVVIAGTSVALFITNQSALDDASKSRARIDDSFAAGAACDVGGSGDHLKCDTDRSTAYDKVNSLDLRKSLSMIGIGVGAVVVGLGAYLLATGDDPAKYDRAPTDLSFAPTGWATATGGGAGFVVGWH